MPEKASEGVAATASCSTRRTLRVLYLFAGKPRKADVRFWLSQICEAAGTELPLHEVDIRRDATMDLLDEQLAKQFRSQIEAGEWGAVIVTPPCNTFSRARYSSRCPGPRPTRSTLHT